MTLTKQMETELYSFIVESNLEYALLEQLEDKGLTHKFIDWLGLEE